MYYEEKCQLGFGSPSNDLFYFGQDDQPNDY